MANTKTVSRFAAGFGMALATALLSTVSGTGEAQPTITAVSGQWSHKANATITGGRFGSKSTAAPLIWDDASGARVLEKWDGAWPDRAQDSNYNIGYRNPMRAVKPPHDRVGRYLAGAHGESSADAGNNVMVWKEYQNTGSMYVSFWYQIDPAWTPGDDDNHKMGIHSIGQPPYARSHLHYAYGVGHGPSSRGHQVKWHIVSAEDAYFLSPNDRLNDSHSWWGISGVGTNPIGRWVKVEYVAKWNSGGDGFLKIYDNGQLALEYEGRTDAAPGTTRVAAVGGFARPHREPNNWRYFADIYFDTTFARVMLGNRDTLEDSTKRELQIPTKWSDSSITVSVNLGVFKDGETAYLYVVDRNGNVNDKGYAVKVGGGGPGPGPTDPTAPRSPTDLRVVRP